MLSRRLWILVAIVCAGFALWHSSRPIEVVYAERTLDDGTVYVSSVQCGTGPGMVFLGSYDQDVRGPATQNDCLKIGRTRIAEVVGLLVLAGALVYVGYRFGKEPPRPIKSELPDLPTGERGFHGRGRRRQRSH